MDDAEGDLLAKGPLHDVIFGSDEEGEEERYAGQLAPVPFKLARQVEGLAVQKTGLSQSLFGVFRLAHGVHTLKLAQRFRPCVKEEKKYRRKWVKHITSQRKLPTNTRYIEREGDRDGMR